MGRRSKYPETAVGKKRRRKIPAVVVLNVDLGLRGIGSRNSGWKFARGIPRIPRRGGGWAGWAGDNLANFIPKMGPRANKGGGGSGEAPRGKRATAWRRPKRARWNPKTFLATQPRVDACTRTRISVYRRDGGDDAAEKRERPIPRDTRGDVSAGRRERIWIWSFFFFFSIEFGRKWICKY